MIDAVQQWKCYNIQFAVLIETDAIFSVLFVVLLILITMFFSCLTWRHSAINSYESRWIMFSCYVMLITWIVYAFLFKLFHLVELRDLFIVIANLLVATSILICMFIRKLIIFYRLNKAKKYNSKTHHLVSSPSISSLNGSSFNGSINSYYGSVGSGSTLARQQALKNKKINEQLKRTAKQSAKQIAKTNSRSKRSKNTSPTNLSHASQMNQDNLDNVSIMSAITTTSSIISSVKSYFSANRTKNDSQTIEQHHQDNLDPDFHLSSIATIDQSQLVNQQQQPELYPMDVYDYETGNRPNQANSQQPDSLFYTTKKNIFNSNHSLYLMEDKDYI